MPFILKGLGLTNNYNDLYDADFRNPIVKAIIVYSIIGTILSAIPYFFYDLDEKKRSSMIKALKVRALFEDHINGELSDDTLTDAMPDIIKAEEILTKENEYDKDSIASAKMVMDEVYKFTKPDYSEDSGEKIRAYVNLEVLKEEYFSKVNSET